MCTELHECARSVGGDAGALGGVLEGMQAKVVRQPFATVALASLAATKLTRAGALAHLLSRPPQPG